MSDKIAIDIALLPPEKIMNAAIRLNKQFESRFILNKTDHLPHITLSQAILNREHLPKAKEKLKKISADFKPLDLRTFVVNKPSAMLEVIRTKELDNLHNKVMMEFRDLISYDVEENFSMTVISGNIVLIMSETLSLLLMIITTLTLLWGQYK